MANKELEKQYNPVEIESKLYDKWIKGGYFHAKVNVNKTPFTIVMPPPNITGQLHMGHALDNTIQDVLIRFKRMQGFETLWVPGTDHASIATEAKVVEKLKESGLTKESIGRESFLEKAWDWREQYGSRIVSQLKRMGFSCDWERERFTMDEGCSNAVKKVFVDLFSKGLIYRGERMINWCPQCLTSISDAEVEHEEQEGKLWHLKYMLSDETGYINLATTRPETLLGDVAVAVNPSDERYSRLVGKTVILPLVNREIPIIADEYVSMEFGTGAVKITPAHDPNDFEVGERHELPVINVMTEHGCITEECSKYAGLDRYEARRAIVRDLEIAGALVKIEEHIHNVSVCYRCHTTIEPRVSNQWFLAMSSLAKPAIDAVKQKKTTFFPNYFEKTYFHWLENIQDWCISRQLWWGHRIPAYYCEFCDEVIVTEKNNPTCPKCGGSVKQDEDTLDTWFSSALWPFSTLGWPEKTEEMNYFYPTNILVTGHDIIPFWVMRMMFSGIEYTGEVPFNAVVIHGLVRDSKGVKMSKSLGNGIDPLKIVDKYGADALRYAIITGNALGNDMRFSEERVEACRNFANKLWNASRFIILNMNGKEFKVQEVQAQLMNEDKWILSKANALKKDVTENMERYELGIAADKIFAFVWEEFCDWYIEMVKPRLYSERDESKVAAQWTLKNVLIDVLKLLHPFIPFLTEEIFCNIQKEEETLVISKWPKYKEDEYKEEGSIESIKLAVRAIRNRRAEMNVKPSKKTKVYIVTDKSEVAEIYRQGSNFFAFLSHASEVTIQKDKDGIPQDAISIVVQNAIIYVLFFDLMDVENEKERLKREAERFEKELIRVDQMLRNPHFIEKAPQKKVLEEREKQIKYKKMKKRIEEQLCNLNKR